MMKVWTAVLVCGAMVSVVAWAVALLRENEVCPFAAVTRFVRGLPWFGRVAVLPLFVALIAYGSVKNSAMDMNHEIHETHEIDGRETNRGFNAESQSRGDTQRGEDGDFNRVEENRFNGIEKIPSGKRKQLMVMVKEGLGRYPK